MIAIILFFFKWLRLKDGFRKKCANLHSSHVFPSYSVSTLFNISSSLHLQPPHRVAPTSLVGTEQTHVMMVLEEILFLAEIIDIFICNELGIKETCIKFGQFGGKYSNYYRKISNVN